MTVGALICTAALGYHYLSLIGMAAGLGLALGLRIKSPGDSLACTAGLPTAVLVAELGAVLMSGLQGFVPVLLLLGTVNLLAARSLLRLAVRRFDDWATREPAERRAS